MNHAPDRLHDFYWIRIQFIGLSFFLMVIKNKKTYLRLIDFKDDFGIC